MSLPLPLQRCHPPQPCCPPQTAFWWMPPQRPGYSGKKPDIRVRRWKKHRHDELLATQSVILDNSSCSAESGGGWSTSTCTIDPTENEEQVAAFVRRTRSPWSARCGVLTNDSGEHGALGAHHRDGRLFPLRHAENGNEPAGPVRIDS